MADIIQEFFVKASPSQVMEMFSTPEGLNRWWTKRSSGVGKEGAEFTLYFSPEFDWHAKITRYVPDREFRAAINESPRGLARLPRQLHAHGRGQWSYPRAFLPQGLAE